MVTRRVLHSSILSRDHAYCPDSLIISHIPTKDYCHFSEDGQIVYVNSEEDTIFHYDMKKQIWIKRKVTTTTALMMIFNLIAGNK
jgi:hypothetical protein